MQKAFCLAGAAALAGLAALAAQAQQSALQLARRIDSVVATATRTQAALPTLRDAIVITREDLDALGGLGLAQVLQLRAGVEHRAQGGPGQPVELFLRGTAGAQALLLVDGQRVASAATGAAAIEAIPPEMVERIEVVKGAMSSLYGSDAIGGVIHVFTRGKRVPHLFASASYGSHDDQRLSAGLASTDRGTHFAFSGGVRRVEAPSASHARAPVPVFDADRDAHENAFATLRASQRLWQGEVVALELFGSRSKTHHDGGAGERSEQRLGGARLTSTTEFARGWTSRFAVGHTRDELRIPASGARFETRQDQASWIHELGSGPRLLVLGVEALRQDVRPDRGEEGEVLHARSRRETLAAFAASHARVGAQHVEASGRYDDGDQFGRRSTGSVGYGFELRPALTLALTLSRGFRAPTFNELYLQVPGSYSGNAALRPERSSGGELSLRGATGGGIGWRVTAFDTRIDDLIVATQGTALNVGRARIRGVETSAEATWLATRWRGRLTLQRPRDEASGRQLAARAETFGSLEASRAFGPVTASAAVVASGARFEYSGEEALRLPSYATLDLRVRYRFPKHWSVELAATNLADRRYESAAGYEAPGRAVLLTLRFDAF